MEPAIDLLGELYTPGLHFNAEDLVGRKIGKLTVVRLAGDRDDGHKSWLCACECGNEKEIASNSLTRTPPVQTCGCQNGVTARSRFEPGAAWNEGKSYAILNGEHCYRTRKAWANAVMREKGESCQRCGWNEGRCDVHHILPKAMGGLNTIKNGKVLCPNCHRVTHANLRSAANDNQKPEESA